MVAALFLSPITDTWSGGIAFSYFPAQSGQGQFGMVTIDGSTVTRSDDFNRLMTQYAQISPPNSPSQDSTSEEAVAAWRFDLDEILRVSNMRSVA